MEHLPVHHLHLKVDVLDELFNSLDPAPFFTQELDPSAEQYIERWAWHYPANSQLHLSVHLARPPADPDQGTRLMDAVRNHFTFRTKNARSALSELLWQGRISLLIGCCFVAVCVLLADLLRTHGSGALTAIFREGLTIIGWVALWRPVQIFLYEWWPLWRRIQVLANIERMRVELLVNNVSLSHSAAGQAPPDQAT